MVPESYAQFVKSVLLGSEGVYYSVKNDSGSHEIYTGTGLKQPADFEKGPFPFFSVHDFMGDISHNWHFSDFEYCEVNKTSTLISELETYSPNFDLNNLECFTGETRQSFINKVNQIKTEARAGELWVANFTQNLTGSLDLTIDEKKVVLKAFYEFLKLKKSHCGGVFVTSEQIFCSLSPETFLVQVGSELRTYPIKGTGQKRVLMKSNKEKAELNMITDLMRNDLGQICEQVGVARERYLTEERNFYHARAEVCGRLKTPFLTHENFKNLLPAGSISGAPKARVLSILKELESFDRQFYTGTFGVRFAPERSIFNILIRTLFIDEKTSTWSFPVGAGITIESEPETEWIETLQKAQILKDCLSH